MKNPLIAKVIFLSIISFILLSGCQQKPVDNSGKIENVKQSDEQSSDMSSSQADTLVVGMPMFPITQFWGLAEDLGYFNDEGVNVKLKYYDSIPAYMEAMFGGELDVMGLAFMDVFGLWSEGFKLKAIVAADYSYGADAIVSMKNTGIDDLKSLKGKTIAVEEGTVSEFFLDYVLTNRAGLKMEDVIKVNYPTKEATNAFLNNEVDAVVTFQPYFQEVMSDQRAQILYDSSNERGLIQDVGVVTPETLEAKKEDITKAFRAWFKAIDYHKQNPEEAMEMMSKRMGITKEEFAAQFDELYIMDLRDNITDLSVSAGADSLFGTGRRIMDFYKARGIDEGMPDTQDLIDDSIVKAIFNNSN